MAIFPQFWRNFAYLSSLGLISLAGVVGQAHPGVAADELVVTYGAFQAVVPIADLETLATTGEASNALQFYLGLANLTPEDLRSLLTTEMHVSHHLLDDMLNSQGGEYMLSEMTQVVHTPSQQASIQALRSTLVLSATDDQQISLLELFQNYPTQQMYVDGINLIQLAHNLSTERITEGAIEGSAETPEIPDALETPETPIDAATDESSSSAIESTQEELNPSSSF